MQFLSRIGKNTRQFLLKHAFGKGPAPSSVWVVLHLTLWGWIFGEFGYRLSNSTGPSMLPTIRDKQCHLVKNLTLRQLRKAPPKVGDIIAFQDPTNPEEGFLLCKRVIFTEGERGWTTYRGCKVEVKVPPNHVWVEGDNKGNSYDSRAIGPISLALVKGKLMATLFPIKKFRWYSS